MDTTLLATCRYTGRTYTPATASQFEQCSFCSGWTAITEGDPITTAYNTTNVNPENPNNQLVLPPVNLPKQEGLRCSHCGHPTLT